MYLLPFPALGGLLAWATIYFLGLRRTKWAEFLLGLVAFFLAMIVQTPIQQLSLLALGIRSNADVITRGSAFIVETALWLGFAAGLVQEGVKYFFVKDKDLRTASFVGLGFGVTEAFFVTIMTAVAGAVMGKGLDVPLGAALMSLLERYFATLFHVGTTVFLAYAAAKGFGKKGLVAMIAVHTLVDSMAAYYQLTGHAMVGYAVEVILALIALLLVSYTLPKVKAEKSGEKVIW
ncbi:YhfC family glutamic-type intramembrane protease [Pyrococcus yayanosii]|uniref:YhfC family intramembrane metalloprotease n=1 Tax=Pyrococcus yayanosii (strain CH1 / JCM 16557) TaxID=529709 RepID=F8AEJ6_PYRYC|nr:YhfC family glutamic-type intramembrane protease [Pyrococcus yayanosii]AEH24675.1 hypothetical protein PYCH_09920 [Pyrococcus yayanosii CH1]